ncbi:jerky protein-like [Nilaparvata lugens]|nr:jerky protein-like [Nilaparvata lugens]
MAKRKYGAWKEEDMERALAAYRNGDIGFNECCRQYGIPKPTLKRHLDGKNITANEGKKSMGRHTTLPPEVEQQLVEHIKKLEACFFGLTITDVRRLAFQIAERNCIPHVFNEESRIAGKKWYYNFMKRHKDISLREPQATSLARAQGFSKENVNEFFVLLRKTVEENKIDATSIFNIDETGVSTVQNKCQKVIAEKGKRAVGSISSGERGVNTTVVCCSSAAGMYVPPLIIFKRMRMCDDLKVGAPPGSLVDISENGWINSELFVKWLRHFIETVKPTKERKVLLLLDGHTTHSKNLEALEIAREAGVIMLQLPGHTTHRLQPLDRSFFKPFKGYFTQAVDKWLRTNPGLRITQYQISQLVNEAYCKAATIENSCNGFKCSGVWPVDASIFSEMDFLPAECLNKSSEENLEKG